MHPIFHITVDQIRRLNDGQARELIARLSRAHLQRAGLDSSSVQWGGDQRAADGGIDVLIEHSPAVDMDGPLRRSAGIIQVKAETFGPAKIGPEMAPKGVLRPTIAALAPQRGTYLIASTRDDPAAPGKRKRVAAMEQVLSDHGFAGQIHVDFLGAREVADWVEQFPPLAIWLRQAIGDPLVGWKGYGPWAYHEDDVQAAFVLSDTPRVFAPGATEAMTDVQGIDAIRADLHAGRSVRLVGLSGVGKTRLAQALFDPRIETNTPALSPERAIYTDISDRPDPSPEAMTEILRSTHEPAVLIVDNCGQETHSALVAKKGRNANTLGLLTIEYDIRDDIPDDTRCYRLEGSSDEALWSVLHSHYPNLSGPDLTTVIAASQGNARLSFALASTSQQTGDLASLRSDDLFRRLFEQKRGAGDELLRCAKAASLIYSFNGEDLSAGSEMTLLSTFARVSAADFLAYMVEIRRRGLLQERGKMRALLPHAVSNRLAAEALEELSAEDLQERLFRSAPARVRASFANRLSYLHSSPDARAIVAKWLAPTGDLGNIGTLSHQDFQIFQRAAGVDLAATLAAIERFSERSHLGLRNEYEIDKLAQITHSIAYEAPYFDRCVEVLLKLAPMQPVNRNSGKRGLEHLKALFQAYGSGTLALAPQRAAHVSRLLASRDPSEREIGTTLLVEALKVRNFRNHGSFQFGARTRTQGWRPRDAAEHRGWFEEFLVLAEPLAIQDDEAGRAIRTALGGTMPGFIRDPLLMRHLEQLAPRLLKIDGWLASLKTARLFLKQKDLDVQLRDRAREFEQLVSPKGLRDQVLAAIAMRDPFDYAKDVEEDADPYQRAAKQAEALGHQLAAEPTLLQELLPRLIHGDVYIQALSIGRGVASATADAQTLVAQVRSQMLSVSDLRSLSPAFVSGLFSGWNDRDPALATLLLDESLNDPVLGTWFTYLQLSVPLDAHGAARILTSIEVGLAPIASYTSLGHGGALKPISIADVTRILNALARLGPEGVHVAIDVLSMVVFSANEREASEQAELAEFCRNFMARIDWPAIGDLEDGQDHEISQIIAFGTKHSQDFEDVRPLLQRVVSYREDSSQYVPENKGNYLSPILRRHPQQALGYLSEQSTVDLHLISDMVLKAWVSDEVGQPRPVMEADMLVDWCAEKPHERMAFCVQICPLDEPADGTISTAARLYSLAPNKPAFIEGIEERCMHGDSSQEEIPNLTAGIRLLERLPVPGDSPEEALNKQAIEGLRKRIDWWNKMLGHTGRERDEGFE
ncbi:hypothetical protein AZ78_1947 [Lysobacter capsici AZ78]|uniref:Uncharacterized protein n=1 Tax=Lysobacter capsici AZ78 TaxID=1444315 RepID=A0A120AGC8_9GAMM|nr:hypothetical protein [Lysobacter capsici]KWS04398.1 hypothetical protein AZ78_1947 [Lysobacter capsici AZ78]